MANKLIRHYGRGHPHFITFTCYRRLLLPRSVRVGDAHIDFSINESMSKAPAVAQCDSRGTPQFKIKGWTTLSISEIRSKTGMIDDHACDYAEHPPNSVDPPEGAFQAAQADVEPENFPSLLVAQRFLNDLLVR